MESQTIGKLAEALSKAQGEMQNAAKDKTNPFFKSTYADLASVWDACRNSLSKYGLAVVQPLSIPEPGKILLTTKLMHQSGEWVSSEIIIQPTKQDPQGVGSAITYMRRFSLSALVGIAPAEASTENDIDDDDDGNAACIQEKSPKEMKKKPFVNENNKIGEDVRRALLLQIAKFNGHTQADVATFFKNTMGKPFIELTEEEYQITLAHFKTPKEVVEQVNPEWEKEVALVADLRTGVK